MKTEEILIKAQSIIDPSIPLISNLANVASILYELEQINWAGFYLAKDDVLYLGPFQGEVACTKIDFGKGVCGSACVRKQTIIVDDVNKFEGHIACSSLSKSEIVTPIIKDGFVLGVIDIDSPIYSRFTEKEKDLLESIAELIKDLF